MKRFLEVDDRTQGTLFPASLDECIDDENMVHVIDAFVDALDLGDLGFKEQMEKLKALEVERLTTEDKQLSLTDPDARSMMISGCGTGRQDADLALQLRPRRQDPASLLDAGLP